MYIRRVARRNKDGTSVRYVQIAHNIWDARSKKSKATILYTCGREAEVDREALLRLARSIERFLRRSEGPMVASVSTSKTSHPETSEWRDGNLARVGKPNPLKASSIFADLNEEQCARLLSLFVELKLKPGQFLFCEGDLLDHFYLVMGGRVKILKHSPSGKDFIMAFCGSGEMLGNVALFSGKPHANSAQAVTHTTVLAIRNDEFLSFLQDKPEMSFKILRRMLSVVGIRLASSLRLLTELAVERADHRLCYVLFTLSLEFGVALPFTREEVAQMAGTTPETAVRFVNRLAELGIVRKNSPRRSIVILNQDKLKLLIDGISDA